MRQLRYSSDDGSTKSVSVQEIEANSLSSALMMDMHSLKPLCGEAKSGRLSENDSIHHYEKVLRSKNVEKRDSLIQLLDSLASFIYFDNIVLDARAVQTFDRGHVFLDLIKHESLEDNYLTKAAIPQIQLSVPPLPGYIMQVAKERRLSLIEATLWIRNSPGASDFRKWLWTKRQFFEATFASDELEMSKLEKHLIDLGHEIASNDGPRGIFLRRSEFALLPSKIPTLEPLLQIIRNRKVKIPLIHVRQRPLYEIFMASWFTGSSFPLMP